MAPYPPYRHCPALGCVNHRISRVKNVLVGGVRVKHRIKGMATGPAWMSKTDSQQRVGEDGLMPLERQKPVYAPCVCGRIFRDNPRQTFQRFTHVCSTVILANTACPKLDSPGIRSVGSGRLNADEFGLIADEVVANTTFI